MKSYDWLVLTTKSHYHMRLNRRLHAQNLRAKSLGSLLSNKQTIKLVKFIWQRDKPGNNREKQAFSDMNLLEF